MRSQSVNKNTSTPLNVKPQQALIGQTAHSGTKQPTATGVKTGSVSPANIYRVKKLTLRERKQIELNEIIRYRSMFQSSYYPML